MDGVRLTHRYATGALTTIGSKSIQVEQVLGVAVADALSFALSQWQIVEERAP